MGRIINPESWEFQERMRWEMFPRHGADGIVYPPGRPYDPNKRFPAMMYKVQRRPDGVYSVGETSDFIFNGQMGEAEAFSRSCQRIVQSESEMDRAYSEGWRKHPKEAIEYHEALQNEISTAAAERAYKDSKMSEKAQAEVSKVDAAAFDHLPEKPEEPITRHVKKEWTAERRAKQAATIAARKKAVKEAKAIAPNS